MNGQRIPPEVADYLRVAYQGDPDATAAVLRELNRPHCIAWLLWLTELLLECVGGRFDNWIDTLN